MSLGATSTPLYDGPFSEREYGSLVIAASSTFTLRSATFRFSWWTLIQLFPQLRPPPLLLHRPYVLPPLPPSDPPHSSQLPHPLPHQDLGKGRLDLEGLMDQEDREAVLKTPDLHQNPSPLPLPLWSIHIHWWWTWVITLVWFQLVWWSGCFTG